MPSGLVDLRSDTVTRPSPGMRRAMAQAEVGDDVYGEDPTVNALEEAFAALVGKDVALYVPTGTMANQLALRLQARTGTTILAGRCSHIASFEGAATGLNVTAQVHTVDDLDGVVDPADIRFAVEAADHHWARPGLVCIENTHMFAGGVPWSLDVLREVAACGLPVHMDGARLLNAVVATGTPAADYGAAVTTIWTAMTKGLGGPLGSVLAGPADVMAEARAHRQRMGGGMRQAGIVAAAGLYALRENVERLADDHERARRLAEAVAERWDGVLDPASVRTNIVIFRHPDTAALVEHLRAEGVLAGTVAPGMVRLVTHLDVVDDGVERARKALASAP